MGRPITPRQIKAIKTLQRRLGLDDGDYRLMLWSVAGVKSCKDLSGPKVDLVISHLRRCAGQAAAPRRRPPQGGPAGPERATALQVKKIEALWGQVSRAPAASQAQALTNWLRNRFKVGALAWLSRQEAEKVIEGLKAMAGRREAV